MSGELRIPTSVDDDMNIVIKHLIWLTSKKHYGKVEVCFEAGRVVAIKKNGTYKPGELEVD